MNELININYENDTPTVLGRDLHEMLELDSNYTTWFNRMCEYGFSEGKDFIPFLEESIGGRPPTNHQLTLNMAKEICMIQRSEKGKQCREYFIAIEEQWNSPTAIMSRALKIADREIKELKTINNQLKVENTIMQPKAEYFDELVDRNLLTSFRETTKELGINEREFVQFLITHKYIYRDKKGKLMPYADKNDGFFEIKECYNEKTQWSGTQTMVTPKGREHFRLICQGLKKSNAKGA